MGIDPSHTSLGLAWRCKDGTADTVAISSASELHDVARQHFLLQYVQRKAETHGIELVAIEGYAYGMKQRQTKAHMAGELSGLLKYMLWTSGVALIIVPPRTLKQFATGSGSASKQKVKVSVVNDWNHWVKTDDEADAFVLMSLAEALESPRVRRKYGSDRNKALKKCQIIEPNS